MTPAGRGAVATILLSGNCEVLDPLYRAVNGTQASQQPLGRIVFGHWGDRGTDDDEVLEEVLVCRRSASAVEIHCHGGQAAAARILRDLERAGCHVQTWEELSTATEGKFVTECRLSLAKARTLRTAAIVQRQSAGVLRQSLESLLSCDLRDSDQRSSALRQIDELLVWKEFGLRLTRSWRVVVTGRPNVGKSSLINALLGFTRAIVHDQPGTTRDVVTAETAFDGWPVELADTAGTRSSSDPLEAAGMELARRHLATADCRLVVLDLSVPPAREDRDLLDAWPNALIVGNKSDLPSLWGELLPLETIRVSALTGQGLEKLIEQIVARLVPCVPSPATAIPLTERQIDLLTHARTALAVGNIDSTRDSVRIILA